MPRESLDRVREALTRLPIAGRAELQAEWRRLYRTEPPARISHDLLIAAIAYRLQEQVLGCRSALAVRWVRPVFSDSITSSFSRSSAARSAMTSGRD